MEYMFLGAENFNSDLSNWNTSSITDFTRMFSGAKKFNSNIDYNASTDKWNTSNVTKMDYMFTGAEAFNGNVGNWDTSNVNSMLHIFTNAKSFNRPIRNWNVTLITDMNNMFSGAHAFNQDISTWNTSNVTNMAQMFQNAEAFNRYINTDNANNYWVTTAVTNMSYMFYGAISFDQDLSKWNTTLVTTMAHMFHGATDYNPVSIPWDTASVVSMNSMFRNATSFTYNIAAYWTFLNVDDIDYFIHCNGYTYTDYGAFLISFANSDVKSGLTLGYTGKIRLDTVDVNAAFNKLTSSNEKNMTIYDGGANTQDTIDTFAAEQDRDKPHQIGTINDIDASYTLLATNNVLFDSGGFFGSYNKGESQNKLIKVIDDPFKIHVHGTVDIQRGVDTFRIMEVDENNSDNDRVLFDASGLDTSDTSANITVDPSSGFITFDVTTGTVNNNLQNYGAIRIIFESDNNTQASGFYINLDVIQPPLVKTYVSSLMGQVILAEANINTYDVTIRDLYLVGYSAAALLEELLAILTDPNGARDAKELVNYVSQFTNAGYNLVEMVRVINIDGVERFTLQELKDIGFKLEQFLTDPTITLIEMKEVGFTAAEFRSAGITAKQLALIGFTMEELQDGGYDLDEIRDAGFNLTLQIKFPESRHNVFQTINNSVLSTARAMPSKGVHSDGNTSFSAARQVHTAVPASATGGIRSQQLKKKWYGNSSSRSSALTTERLRNRIIGNGSINQSGQQMSFTNLNDVNARSEAIRRTRAGGTTVPRKFGQTPR
jgi:surface protein